MYSALWPVLPAGLLAQLLGVPLALSHGPLPLQPLAAAPACVALEQDQALAKDLARGYPWFARLDPALVIAPTPLAGVTRQIPHGELAALARRNSIPLESTDALPSVCIERATAALTPELLQPLMEQALGGRAVRILEYSRNRVPRGEIQFARAGLAANGMWRGRVIYGAHHSTPVWAKVALAAGTVDSPAPRPLSSDVHAIQRGEQVTVEVTSGGARLAFQATAESTGHVGDFVLVRNPGNGRLFQAKALGNGKVIIHK
jgi:hypothetical protein